MPDTVEAEVSGTFVHAGDGEVYSDGETCEVGEETIERHPTVLERAAGDESDTSESPEDADAVTVDSLLDGTVDEVEEILSRGGFDNRLDDIEEQADRVGIEDAVADRRDDLED